MIGFKTVKSIRKERGRMSSALFFDGRSINGANFRGKRMNLLIQDRIFGSITTIEIFLFGKEFFLPCILVSLPENRF